MKRHKALISLSHDHHHGLMLAQLIKSGSPEYKGLPNTLAGKVQHAVNFFEEHLIPHFKKEEEILFPAAKSKSSKIDNLVDELMQQHKTIYSLIDKLKSSSSPEAELNELGILLDNHIRKEERELFQIIQDTLTENDMNKLEIDFGDSTLSCKV
jgi:iron-sulfur cluster repair protein YtfE (RIC family)